MSRIFVELMQFRKKKKREWLDFDGMKKWNNGMDFLEGIYWIDLEMKGNYGYDWT